LSQPLRVGKGVQLIKVVGRQHEGVGTFEEEKEKVREILELQKLQENNARLLQRMKNRIRTQAYR